MCGVGLCGLERGRHGVRAWLRLRVSSSHILVDPSFPVLFSRNLLLVSWASLLGQGLKATASRENQCTHTKSQAKIQPPARVDMADPDLRDPAQQQQLGAAAKKFGARCGAVLHQELVCPSPGAGVLVFYAPTNKNKMKERPLPYFVWLYECTGKSRF